MEELLQEKTYYCKQNMMEGGHSKFFSWLFLKRLVEVK
jgi:hypothetical protein